MAATAAPTAVYRVREAFAFDDAAGRPYTMRKGDLVDASHPAVTPARMTLLEEVSPEVVRAQEARTSITAADAVEQATAAPGERRHVRAKA